MPTFEEPVSSGTVPDEINIEIPISEGGVSMAVDLADGVAQAILNSAVNAHQLLMTETQANAQHANNITRLTAAKKFDELGTLEGKAAQGITAVPHGAPAGPHGAGA